jgi:hypothetical protein
VGATEVTQVTQVTHLPPRHALGSAAVDRTAPGSAVLDRTVLDGTAQGNTVLDDMAIQPVLPALRDLFPAGGLERGSVVAAGHWSLLCLALAAEASATGAWCAVAGLPQAGMAAAADAGLEPDRILLIPDPGPGWPQVVASLLDGCELVLLRPPDQPSAQVRLRVEAVVRRFGGVLVVAGDWAGARLRLQVTDQEWAGIGTGHGRLRARLARVAADGRGAAARSRARWLWLPAPDGSVAAADHTGAQGAFPGGPAIAAGHTGAQGAFPGGPDAAAGHSGHGSASWPELRSAG